MGDEAERPSAEFAFPSLKKILAKRVAVKNERMIDKFVLQFFEKCFLTLLLEND